MLDFRTLIDNCSLNTDSLFKPILSVKWLKLPTVYLFFLVTLGLVFLLRLINCDINYSRE